MQLTRLRGLIGPLGDDLPSLFPIVAAILLFSGTVFYANQLVDQKNRELSLRQGVLSLSYLVTEKGLMNNRSQFKLDLCIDQITRQANSLQVHFLITVKKYCQFVDFYKPGVSPDYQSPYYVEQSDAPWGPLSQGRTWDYCTDQFKNGNLWDLKNDKPVAAPGVFPVPKDAVVLSYPMAVNCSVAGFPTNGMGLVNVIGWR